MFFLLVGGIHWIYDVVTGLCTFGVCMLVIYSSCTWYIYQIIAFFFIFMDRKVIPIPFDLFVFLSCERN